MIKPLTIASILLFAGCTNSSQNPTQSEAAEPHSEEDLSDSLVYSEGGITFTFSDRTDPWELGLYQRLDVSLQDAEEKVVLTLEDEYLELNGRKFGFDPSHVYSTETSTIYLIAANNRPEPDFYYLIEKVGNEVKILTKTEPLTLEIFGDVDQDGRLELGGFDMYCQGATEEDFKNVDFCLDQFRVFEVGDSIVRDWTTEEFEKQKIRTLRQEEKNQTEKTKESMTSELILGERIDGPANIRDSINGKLLFELNDGALVETMPTENHWLEVGVHVLLTPQQIEEFKILPGDALYSEKDVMIGVAKDTVPLLMHDSEYGFIAGMTHENNIIPESVPEKALVKLLEKGAVSKVDFNEFLEQFSFKNNNVRDLENIEEWFIYQSFLVDPSPRDRMTLLFSNNQLIGIVHSRDLPTTNFKTVELTRGHRFTISGNLTATEIKNLSDSMIQFYNSVD